MSHKLLEKIDDIVADNRITENEYITICSLLKDTHSKRNDVLINDLREQIVELKDSINWFECVRDELIDDLNEVYKSRDAARDELNTIYKSREVMVNLNRELHKELKTVRDKFKQDIADKIIEISHLKKELKDGDSLCELTDVVDCCCGSVIKRSGLSKHLKTIKHREYIGEL